MMIKFHLMFKPPTEKSKAFVCFLIIKFFFTTMFLQLISPNCNIGFEITDYLCRHEGVEGLGNEGTGFGTTAERVNGGNPFASTFEGHH